MSPGIIGPWLAVPGYPSIRVRVHGTANRLPDVEIETAGRAVTVPAWRLQDDHRNESRNVAIWTLLNQLCSAHADLWCPLCPSLCAHGHTLPRFSQETCAHRPDEERSPRPRRRVQPGDVVGYTADFLVLLGCTDPRGWGTVLPEIDPDPRWVTVRWESGAETLEDPALLGRRGTDELALDRYVGIQVGLRGNPWDRRHGGAA